MAKGLYRTFVISCAACDTKEHYPNFTYDSLKDYAESYFRKKGWHTHKGKWICPDCTPEDKSNRVRPEQRVKRGV